MITQNLGLYTVGLLISFFAYLSSAQSSGSDSGSGGDSGFGSFPTAVLDEMSTREERYHHFLWHNIRDNWNRFGSDVQEEIRRRGWEPPRPSRSFSASGTPSAIIDNNSGEDFLYMHREMINRVREIVGDDSDAYEQLTGWTTIPGPDDIDWPVPDEYEIRGSPATSDAINGRKTDAVYDQMVRLEDMFTNEDELRSMTLGQLGSRIENTVHNWLHLRFSSESTFGYRPGTSGAFPIINEGWDDPDYDWLGDTYSSHLNPVFWKLHGWVDDRIEDWRRANDIDEIEWTGTWEGGPMDAISDVLESGSASGGFSPSSVEGRDDIPVTTSFADDVQVDLGTSGKISLTSQVAPSTPAASNVKPKSKPKRCRL